MDRQVITITLAIITARDDVVFFFIIFNLQNLLPSLSGDLIKQQEQSI